MGFDDFLPTSDPLFADLTPTVDNRNHSRSLNMDMNDLLQSGLSFLDVPAETHTHPSIEFPFAAFNFKDDPFWSPANDGISTQNANANALSGTTVKSEAMQNMHAANASLRMDASAKALNTKSLKRASDSRVGAAPKKRHTIISDLGNVSDDESSSRNNEEGKIGAYTVEERKKRIARFHEMRRNRVYRKRIKYSCRKMLADNRLRVKGRFVKRAEGAPPLTAAACELAQTQKAMDAAHLVVSHAAQVLNNNKQASASASIGLDANAKAAVLSADSVLATKGMAKSDLASQKTNQGTTTPETLEAQEQHANPETFTNRTAETLRDDIPVATGLASVMNWEIKDANHIPSPTGVDQFETTDQQQDWLPAVEAITTGIM